ncbi:hypothetical protein [Propioniciclava soli]|uniref:ABC transporter permease n=1 Tax=Propioniciclava soli TaxID=2775081 RepID=A0ABZ3CAW5_9ACTN|nr:hypothetical protein [Propioniciclava soli]
MSALVFALGTGLKDAWRVGARGVLAAVHVAVAALLLGLSAGLAVQSAADLAAAQRLVEARAVSFVVGNPPAQDADVTQLRAAVAGVLAGERGCAVIRSGNGDVLVFGASAASEIASRGGYLDPWWGFTPTPAGSLSPRSPASVAQLDTVAFVDLAARMVLLDPTPDALRSYLQALRQVTDAEPRLVADKIRWDFRSEYQGRVAFLTVFALGMLTTLSTTLSAFSHLLRSNKRGVIVAWALGASPLQVGARWVGFIAAVWSLPALALSFLGLQLVSGGYYAPVVLPWVATVITALTLAGAWWGSRWALADVALESLREQEV